MEFVRWAKVFDGHELIVHNVAGLKLIGAGKATQLLAKPRYANVLTFDGCTDIALENLVLGHTPAGYCEGGVVRMSKCRAITINKCDLFGCGIEGLTLSDVAGLRFSHSTIRDCTYGIMTVSGSSDILMSDSRFIRNKEFGGFAFSDSRNIRLERCAINNNHFDSLAANLFSATSCSDIIISGGEITGNVYKGIMSPIDCVKIINTKIESNTEPADGDR
jgi:polygalacturonase